jgi:uncharacterized Zn-binding protein involved in type VI secretion|tara:strand:+ start:172 stop:459 length:288 start_codon:yes stop_codon:yes gene_type:complete
MPAVAIASGTVVDTAGAGTITPSNATVRANASAILLVGDVVSAHTAGATTHPTNAISTGSSRVRVNGKSVAYSGSVAACGGSVTTSFSPTVLVGA